MLGREADLESADGDVIEVTIYLIVHFPVSVRVHFQGLSFSHGQGQKRVQGPWYPTTRDKTRAKVLGELLKGVYGIGPKPSNHLIATGPKLEGKTFHIKASFLEWIAILWLNWLTCSIRSVRPLYMVNVG